MSLSRELLMSGAEYELLFMGYCIFFSLLWG